MIDVSRAASIAMRYFSRASSPVCFFGFNCAHFSSHVVVFRAVQIRSNGMHQYWPPG